jgi:predicted porin
MNFCLKLSRSNGYLNTLTQIARCFLVAGLITFAFQGAVSQEPVANGTETRALLERIDRLEQALVSMQARLDSLTGKDQGRIPSKGEPPPGKAGAAVASSSATNSVVTEPNGAPGGVRHRFLERKPGKDLTFFTPNGELTVYGNLDVSFDAMTKGTSSLIGPDGVGPVGNMGWLPDLSTNISYAGVRGMQRFGSHSLAFIYQLETEIDIASASGSTESNSSETNTVKAGLTGRNSYLGLSSPPLGAVMFGKTFAPYKLSTAKMNPFASMIGDNAVIMGNSGGDNRVEFGTLLDHSIWYTSPTLGGWQTDILYSPGQNRANDSDNIAAGEADCTGGDIPGSGGSLPFACNDGSFSDAVSASVSYTREPLYLTVAYERHRKVNRSSDLTGMYANPPVAYFNADTADEDAAKVGLQYTLAGKTTVSAVFESLHRYLPGFLEFQNERQRFGSWLAVTQTLNRSDSVAIGWARAYRTPGDPGQHNTSTVLPPLGSPGDGVGGRGADNSANLFTATYSHMLFAGLSVYTSWAATFNGPYAHYDLGAGGRIVTADCHDASDATGGESSNPHCWAGGHLMGVSVGINRHF